MTAMTTMLIKTARHYVFPRRGPTMTRYVAAIDGAWLLRKDGAIRKFNTRHAARKAAIAEINEINNPSSNSKPHA